MESVILHVLTTLYRRCRMKRFLKLTSLLLIASMALSVCACDARRKGVDPVVLDEYEKPEHSVETSIPEPTETAPAPTEPDQTTPEPTATPTPETNYQPGEIKDTIDLIKLSEATLGMTPDDATVFLTQALKLQKFTPVDGLPDSNNIPTERFLRYLDKDIVVDGVNFKSIGMHMKGTKVYQVSYTLRTEPILAKDESFDSKGVNETLSAILNKAYGSPISGYTEQWIDFTEKGVTGWNDGDYIVSLFWGKGCQGNAKNDQLVLEITYQGDISSKNPTGQVPDPTGTTPSPTDSTPLPTGGSTTSTELTCDYVYVMSLLTLGQRIEAAKVWVESFLFVKLGDPKTETSSDKSYTVYSYPVDVKIDGRQYDQVDIYVSSSKNTTYSISFLTKKDGADAVTDYYKLVTDRFKQLIKTAPDETSSAGKEYASHFKAAENIDLNVTATLKGNDSRCVINVEDKTQK